MTFPFATGKEDLTGHDFNRFELQFSRSVLDFLPCQQVSFFFIEPDAEGHDGGPQTATQLGCSETWAAGIVMVRQQLQPVVDPEGMALFLPIWNGAQLAAVAVLNGGSQDLYGKYTSEWLLDRSRFVSREFRKIKRWSIDPVTGLLNSVHLGMELELLRDSNLENDSGSEAEKTPAWHLFLIEVHSRSQDAGQSLQSIGRIGAYLDSLVGEFSSVHHVGVGVFALLWHGNESDEIQKLGYAILRKLKRQNTTKAHIGITPLSIGSFDHSQASQDEVEYSETILALAWNALKAARQRGVFALCSASALGGSHQPIALPTANVVSQFQKLWRRHNLYSIVLLQKDIKDQDHFSERVKALAGETSVVVPIDANEAYVLLPGTDEENAVSWAKELFAKVYELGVGSFSAGIATYPCPGFKKIDVLTNARKALLHTNFFGLGSMTSFNAVSLNISGDVYYNDGDLLTAISEYKLGLNLDPDNVNLLNSLGVIYAQIDKHVKAIPLFERALHIDAKDFMASYNLGFAHLSCGYFEQALLSFEKALAVDDSYFDLLLQVGQLYCQTGCFKKAVQILGKAEKTVAKDSAVQSCEPWERCEPWHHTNNQLGHGLVYRYLGEAYRGIKKNKQAMTYLQKATRYNSRDAYALSLLGEMYVKEKQGNEIALSLCMQAVELDDSKDCHWFRLAYVYFACKEYDSAKVALQRCLKLAPRNIEAMMLLARIYNTIKLPSKARMTYERVLRLDGTNNLAKRALKKINI